MENPVTIDDLAAYLGVSVSDLPANAQETLDGIWYEILDLIKPNAPKTTDLDFFKAVVLRQYGYTQTEDYKMAAYSSFTIGDFRASKGSSDGVNKRFSPVVISALSATGYLCGAVSL
ncbi:hypothetical protein AGMMS49975_22880 [Clostridia bacterium]|nr:hypothetical protein AGMMS49975_22880 [Clostridia bacterium]